jgi:predicted ATPase/DNA-binding SARP family transcriptional activator/DNA-binding CsgD family transcriptional regulator
MRGKPQEALRVELLGGFRVSVGSRTVGEDGWRLKKAKSLLKLLALAPGHRMHREQLAQWLWPDCSAPNSQANNLRQALHATRRALVVEPAAAATGPSSNSYLRLLEEEVALCPEGPLWVDVEAFEEAVTTARRIREPAAYRAALDLYAGELLPEDRYEEWAQERREALHGRYLVLLVELAVLHEERGKFAGAIEALRRVVVAEPTREEAHAELMRLYSLTGRRREALLQYERLRKALSEELGVEEPGEAGRLLYEEIRAGRTPTSGSRAQTPTGNGTQAEPHHSSRHNLPLERTSFVGREEEMVEVERLLAMTDLLTFTGAGGSGKTRFAVEVARRLAGTYEDGAWLVELAPLSSPDLVERTVAAALGVREQSGHSLTDVLKDYLSSKKLLLVMDNCEHLIEAATGLAETLLGSCPKLKVLATSREALNIAGELIWPVRSLSVPDDASGDYYSPTMVEDLARYESVRLFVERAQYRRSSFELTPDNALAVAEVCRRLEGIPLAIELAAARVGVLSIGQISGRLKDSLGVLAGGSRTAEPRQRTLRGALEWSYELLGELERYLYGRLSTFWGGWSLEAAEAVGAGRGIEEEDVLDLLGRLVDKSLVVAESGDPEGDLRYRMLEPVRQYGREKLEESGEEDEVGRRHALFFLALAEEIEPKINTADRRRWLERLESEHDNLRAALAWSRKEAQGETGLRLAGALFWFWFHRGYLSEGRRWLGGALATEEGIGGLPAPASSAARAKTLCGAGLLAWMQGDQAAASSRLGESVTLWRKAGEKQGLAQALRILSHVVLGQGATAVARSLGEESVELFRESNDEFGLATSLATLGIIALTREEYGAAQSSLEESVAICRESGDDWALSLALRNLGIVALKQGDYEQATAWLGESMLALQEPRGGLGLVNLDLLAAAVSLRGDHEWATRLFGAAEAVREAVGVSVIPSIRTDYNRGVAAARAGLGEAAFAAAWAEGKAMPLEQAVEYALSAKEEPTKTPAPEGSPTDGGQPPDALTPREREVAALVAQELTNRRIAKELVISERTVTTHVHKILKKLNLRSRIQIAAWAMEQELLR